VARFSALPEQLNEPGAERVVAMSFVARIVERGMLTGCGAEVLLQPVSPPGFACGQMDGARDVSVF
jgi:hypothetical protein